MIYNIHGGHNPAGKIACGATGLLDESREDRLISSEIQRILQAHGNTVYNCTVDNGTSQNDVLKKIVAKCNAHSVDYDISIHLNSGRNDYAGDGSTGGFEVWCTDTGSGKGALAERIRKNMKSLGFTDRGTKTTSGLYFLNHTKAPAILLEICFVDDKDDYNLYTKLGYQKISQAIAFAIMNKTISEGNRMNGLANSAASDGNWYYYNNGSIDKSYTGFAQNKNGWFWINAGKVDFTVNGLKDRVINGVRHWYYVKAGKVDFTHCGLVHKPISEGDRWWYVRKGEVDFNYTGFAANDGGIWYVKNGCIDFSQTGEIKIKISKNKVC